MAHQTCQNIWLFLPLLKLFLFLKCVCASIFVRIFTTTMICDGRCEDASKGVGVAKESHFDFIAAAACNIYTSFCVFHKRQDLSSNEEKAPFLSCNLELAFSSPCLNKCLVLTQHLSPCITRSVGIAYDRNTISLLQTLSLGKGCRTSKQLQAWEYYYQGGFGPSVYG